MRLLFYVVALYICIHAAGCVSQRAFNREVREREEWSRTADMHRLYINELEDRVNALEKAKRKKAKPKPVITL